MANCATGTSDLAAAATTSFALIGEQKVFRPQPSQIPLRTRRPREQPAAGPEHQGRLKADRVLIEGDSFFYGPGPELAPAEMARYGRPVPIKRDRRLVLGNGLFWAALRTQHVASGVARQWAASASDSLAQFRGLSISLRAPSGDYLIANSPFRHLQEPWHDAAPLRSPRLCPDPPPPPADLAGRRLRRALGQPECRVFGLDDVMPNNLDDSVPRKQAKIPNVRNWAMTCLYRARRPLCHMRGLSQGGTSQLRGHGGS